MKWTITLLLAATSAIAVAQQEYTPNQPCYDFQNNEEGKVYDVYQISAKKDTCSWADDWRNSRENGVDQHFEGALPYFIGADFLKMQNPNGGYVFHHFTDGLPSNKILHYTFSIDKQVYEVKTELVDGLATRKVTISFADPISLTRTPKQRKYMEGFVQNGEIVGDWIFYNNQGQITDAVSYLKGKAHPRKIKHYDDNGKLKLITTYDGNEEIARQEY